MKAVLKSICPFLDIILAPFVFLAGLLLRGIRDAGIWRLPMCKASLLRIGVFPIRSHYYEPLFDPKLLRHPLDRNRDLPGVDWNTAGQLRLLSKFRYSAELSDVPKTRVDDLTYYQMNGFFGPGDAEYLYSIIRFVKPARIIEIGSGNSTLMAIRAIKQNVSEDPDYRCRHVCVEPYEMPWLERTGVVVHRQRVEEIDKSLFAELEDGDLLFIDSSHVIRPQGDVLCEILELIPTLRAGVIVHIHDIFSPRDYPADWIVNKVRMWNEQYLLEAFLSCNREWKIIGALNFLHLNYFQELKAACPFLTADGLPASFYIQKKGSQRSDIDAGT